MTAPSERPQPLEIQEIELSVKESDAVPAQPQPRDAAYWAPKVERLSVGAEHAEMGFNVAGRRVTGPQQGFGRLWQRTYSATLRPTITPQQLIAEWKDNFGSFWPKGNRFGADLIAPGEVAAIAVNTGAGLKLATGVLVLYADPESFTFMTPQGHMFAGWITFSGHTENETTVMRIQIMLRTSDPLFELSWPVMRRMEDRFWRQTLRNVAAHFGITGIDIDEKTVALDKRRQWRNWRNVWHNSAIRSMLHLATAPVRLARRAAR
ncbi:MAG TPA: hypothetical protein VFJ98_00985 [Mycobacteriales bacterium]|nr:hypothetical protein [Mycobacteriales bacterium]